MTPDINLDQFEKMYNVVIGKTKLLETDKETKKRLRHYGLIRNDFLKIEKYWKDTYALIIERELKLVDNIVNDNNKFIEMNDYTTYATYCGILKNSKDVIPVQIIYNNKIMYIVIYDNLIIYANNKNISDFRLSKTDFDQFNNVDIGTIENTVFDHFIQKNHNSSYVIQLSRGIQYCNCILQFINMIKTSIYAPTLLFSKTETIHLDSLDIIDPIIEIILNTPKFMNTDFSFYCSLKYGFIKFDL